jgi:hypothetical protein
MKRFLKIAGYLVLFVSLLVTIFPQPRAAIVMMWVTHRLVRENPMLRQKPAPLPDVSVANWKGLPIRVMNSRYEVEVPASDYDASKVKDFALATNVFLGSHSGFVVKEEASAFEMLKTSNAIDRLTLLHGPTPFASEAAVEDLILNTTPSDVPIFPLFNPRGINFVLLTEKAITLPSCASEGFYRVKTAEFSGFQAGTPGTSKMVMVFLYGKDAGVSLLFGTPGNSVQQFSQADINRIVQSVHGIGPPAMGERGRGEGMGYSGD